MKRTAAILLVFLCLFSSGGYRVIFYFILQETSDRLISKLDKYEYNEADLVEFTVPLHMPYQNDWADFKRVDGEIVIEGVLYRYVKQKVKGNELIIKCVRNREKKDILNLEDAFFRSINGIDQYNVSNKATLNCQKIGLVFTDYYFHGKNSSDYSPGRSCIDYRLPPDSYFKTANYFYIPEQPPEIVTS